MNSDRVIESAIRAAKNLLWQNLPPIHTLPEGATVARVRELVNSPSIQSALQCGSDTFLAFVLREVQFVIADRSLADRQILGCARRSALEPSLGDHTKVPPDTWTLSKETFLAW
jgi:hypothetical protein